MFTLQILDVVDGHSQYAALVQFLFFGGRLRQECAQFFDAVVDVVPTAAFDCTEKWVGRIRTGLN